MLLKVIEATAHRSNFAITSTFYVSLIHAACPGKGGEKFRADLTFTQVLSENTRANLKKESGVQKSTGPFKGTNWLLLLLLAHAGRVGLFCLQVKELSNLYRPKPQVCWGEWGGVLGAVEKVTCCVGGKGTGWAKVGDGAVEAG